MLYRLIKPIIRMSLLIYFRRFDIVGRNRLPKSGPVIYVANHPSALMDPLVVAITLRSKVHFLAGAEWFGKGLRAAIFKRHFNMIPVHRPWLAKGKKVSNEDMFKECYRSLDQGKCIILFPEASSTTVSKIRELKTGAIRIKDGFEEYANHQKEVPVIPIGISYSNPHEFQSRVVVTIGKPVDFGDDYNTTDPAELAKLKTNKIQQALQKAIVNIENDSNEKLVKRVVRLFLDTYKQDSERSFKDSTDNFEYAQRVALAVEHFEEQDPLAFEIVAGRISDYFAQIREIGISDDIVGGSTRIKPSFWKILLLIIGAPIALIGFIIFILPYQLTKLIFRKKLRPLLKSDEEDATFDQSFTGSLVFAVGMLIFIVWSVILAVVAGLIYKGILFGLLVFLLIHPVVRFALYYYKIALRLRRFLKGKKLKKRHAGRVRELELKRESIITELKEYQGRYNAEQVK